MLFKLFSSTGAVGRGIYGLTIARDPLPKWQAASSFGGPIESPNLARRKCGTPNVYCATKGPEERKPETLLGWLKPKQEALQVTRIYISRLAREQVFQKTVCAPHTISLKHSF